MRNVKFIRRGTDLILMPLKSRPRADFKVLIFAVAMLAAVFAAVEGTSPLEIDVASLTRSLPASREPAALAAPTMKPAPVRPRDDVMEWNADCAESIGKKLISFEGRHARFKGKVCKGLQDLESFELSNESNGFTATIFWQESRFQTDLVPLQAGANRLKLKYVNRAGREVEAHLDVHAQLPQTP